MLDWKTVSPPKMRYDGLQMYPLGWRYLPTYCGVIWSFCVFVLAGTLKSLMLRMQS